MTKKKIKNDKSTEEEWIKDHQTINGLEKRILMSYLWLCSKNDKLLYDIR